MKKNIILSISILLSMNGFSQNVGINSTGAAPDASAILDVSSNNKGLLIPRMTEAQRTSITTPAIGLLVYQTNVTRGFWYYNGTIWINLNEDRDWNKTSNGVDQGKSTNLNDTIYTTGLVGIRTLTPTVPLVADGGIDASLGGGGYFMVNGEGGENVVIDENEIMARDNGTASELFMQGEGGDFVVHNLVAGTQFIVEDGGNVGIGTATPINKLQVNGKISVVESLGDDMVIINDNNWTHGNGNQNFGAGGDYFIMASREGSTESSGIYGGGDHATIWSPGDGNRTLRFLDEDLFDNDGDPYDNNAEVAYIDANGAYVTASDSSRKENISKIENALYSISQINGYTYKYKQNQEEIKKGELQLVYGGVIAQEIEKVFPVAVQTDEYGGKFVHYDGLSGLFIEAIKEQQTIIDDQAEKIKEQDERLKKIEAQLQELLNK